MGRGMLGDVGIAEFVHDRAVLPHDFVQSRDKHALRGIRAFQQR